LPVTADNAAKLALLPLLAGQALWVRARAHRLPEPEGPREGATGKGVPLRLLIAGDSSAAGVGCASQDEALSGRLTALLAATHRVEWQLVARTGATTRETLERIAALPRRRFDLAVLALGVNDVTRSVPLASWLRRQARLYDLLEMEFGVRRVLISGLPPMRHFPLLPQPLRWVLGRTAERFDGALAELAAGRAGCEHIRFDLPFDAAMMARDGFHPGPEAYALWARMLGRRIMG
jgi:lysophospholipase L1-like esterase